MPRKREVPADVAEILARSTIEGHLLKLPEQLDRETYLRVNKVLAGLEGKWTRTLAGHVFPYDPAELLAKAVDEGEFVDRKQALQLFETPVELAQRMCVLAGLGGPHKLGGLGKVVLEPSAGRGRIVHAIHDTHALVTAVEIDERNVRELSCMRTAAGSSLIVHRADFPVWAASYRGEKFDAVVMNPPFRSNEDIRHVQAAWPLVKPSGRLVSIVSEHAFFARDRASREFRQWLQDLGGRSEPLPGSTFSDSGTGVNTRLLEIRKREGRQVVAVPKPDLPLFNAATA